MPITFVNRQEAQEAAASHSEQWNGTNNAGEQVASRVPLCRLQAGEFVQTRLPGYSGQSACLKTRQTDQKVLLR
ncbi:MAG: hypothetical protein D6732_05195 [Methanobacteriota archaeon]|nr:MAG: hypothetical protein D6732_05195 [Euryarchaeota archaeon]